MEKWKNGKIYVIKSHKTDEVYVGSTCDTLKKRFWSHKSEHKSSIKNRKSKSYRILKYGDAYIELIEEFPCDTKRQLLDREGVVTRMTLNRVNIIIQGRTPKQYNEDNKEELKEKRKIYYHEHKEEQKIKNKKYKDEHKEELKEKRKIYLADNKEKTAKTYKIYAEKHKEERKEKRKIYLADNKDKIQAVYKSRVKCSHCGLDLAKASLLRHKKKQHPGDLKT